MKSFELIFGNGGGVTLQTEEYCHFYDYPERAAEDVKDLIEGSDTEDWEGNEEEARMEYDYDVECNGGYRWLSQYDVAEILKAGQIDTPWGNMRTFFSALGCTVVE